MLSANATRRCLPETGSALKVETTTKVVGRGVEAALGEAEWAATQTVHFADSVALECWCAANAIADHNVSNTHRHAIRFEIDRMTTTPKIRCLNLYQNGKQKQRQYLTLQCLRVTRIRVSD